MEDSQFESPTSQTGSKSANLGLFLGILVVLAVAAFFVFKPKSQVSMEATPTAEPTQASQLPTQAVTTEGVKEFVLEGGSFYYKPNVITVKKGDKVKVTMNSVSMMHDFVIDELNVKSEVAPSGKAAVVEFTADKAGSFEFYCSVGQHRANGMVGTLVVTE
jgi:nitrosocyanin